MDRSRAFAEAGSKLLHAVAHTAQGGDEPSPEGALQLTAEVADIDLDAVTATVQESRQLLAGDHLAAAVVEKRKDTPLGVGQGHRRSAHAHRTVPDS